VCEARGVAAEHGVVALFAADKARLGDVFYDGVAARSDPLVDQWKRETAYEGEAMNDRQPGTPDQPGFVRGNERLDELLADPQLAADVAAAHADAEEMDRVYAMNLAMIRKAAQMTQVEVARKLGVGQGVVSRLEHRDDMLLSTLYDYLMATGADGAGIVVTVHGQRIELDLARLRSYPQQQTA
jgi:DNA-binding transcriptional regulator YiaG